MEVSQLEHLAIALVCVRDHGREKTAKLQVIART